MEKPWLILGLYPDQKHIILWEFDRLTDANIVMEKIPSRYKGAIICWVESREKYEKNNMKS